MCAPLKLIIILLAIVVICNLNNNTNWNLHPIMHWYNVFSNQKFQVIIVENKTIYHIGLLTYILYRCVDLYFIPHITIIYHHVKSHGFPRLRIIQPLHNRSQQIDVSHDIFRFLVNKREPHVDDKPTVRV